MYCELCVIQRSEQEQQLGGYAEGFWVENTVNTAFDEVCFSICGKSFYIDFKCNY